MPDQETPSADVILTTRQAAAMCGVSPETIRRWIRTKGLPAYNTDLGLRIRIRLSDLRAFAQSHNILLQPLPTVQASEIDIAPGPLEAAPSA